MAPAAAAGQSGPQVWLNPGMFSHHFRDDQDYREKNYGAGIELFITPRHGFLAGSFLNSNDERSRYVGYHWRPWQRQAAGIDFSGGLAFALIDGYSNTRDGKTFAVVLPALSAEYGVLGAHLIFIPHPKNASALALQLRLRVW
jgi:hypothetical protein